MLHRSSLKAVETCTDIVKMALHLEMRPFCMSPSVVLYESAVRLWHKQHF